MPSAPERPSSRAVGMVKRICTYFGWHPSSRICDRNSALPNALPSGGRHSKRKESSDVVEPIIPAVRSPAEDLERILTAAACGNEFAVADKRESIAEEAARGSPEPTAGFFRCMTSGTSGSARMVRRTQESWIASFRMNERIWRIGPSDIYAIPGNLGHSLPLYGALEAVHLGADVQLLGGLRPDRQFSAISEGAVSVIYAVPTQVRLLADSALSTGRAAPGVRLILVGGSKLDAATRRAASHAFPEASICEFYGSAETSFVTLSTDDTPAESVGPAFPGVEIRINSPDPQDVPGEIWVRSPYLFDRYIGPEGCAKLMGGFLSVGELGRLDSGGFLHLAGRSDRMVSVSGKNVHPEAAERFLSQLDGVLQAAVMAEADSIRGNRLVAYVQLAQGRTDLETLAKRCKAAVGPSAAPRRYLLRNDWPLLPSGKTDYLALAASSQKLSE